MKKNKVFIIAEAGVNHNGSLKLAKKMVEKAVEAKVDAIKFQTFIAKNLVSRNTEKANYQKLNTNNKESQLEMIKKLELSFEQFIELKRYCDEMRIKFLSTPFDLESIEFLKKLGMKIWKVPSGEITNLPYLRKIAEVADEIILSTGMSDLCEISKAVEILKKENKKILILHCNTEYPTPMEDVNLRAMELLKEKFNVEVGYSDHTLGIEVPIAAVALGARIIEKHFTLDKNMEGPDHKASLEPEELKKMVTGIRNIEKALGKKQKEVTESEKKNKDIARKSIVAKKNIKKGEIFTEENLTVKRPGNGISPMQWDEVIGKISIRNFEEDELIEI
ncbi:N-acetylneuraminate synthase [Fusobacterium ulcerans]|jgi:N,N'-diacetyllegionaminate synthase|uniref:N-acetylneuraminate synthase n=1 Tax=Fusobacterium ulcerans TaxID=861 RepID=UPI000E50686A|nr:N-acetylneuraminate synthase [Fusobacterium ulcerans]RGY59141.1 N-acetylneuraminate synthase [Fusobacterium ulcerans]